MKWTPGVDFSAGSLEWAFLMALVAPLLLAWMATTTNLRHVGRGELQEGSIWEAAMATHMNYLKVECICRWE